MRKYEYEVAYGIHIPADELSGWFDAAKIRQFAADNVGLTLEMDEGLPFAEMVDSAMLAHNTWDGFCYLLERADDSDLLTPVVDGEGDAYLLFFPTFPWDESRRFLPTQEDVQAQAIKVLRPFVHDAVTDTAIHEAFMYVSGDF